MTEETLNTAAATRTRETWQDALAAARVSEELDAFIRRYAERHEVTFEGADLWEGRCRYDDDPEALSLLEETGYVSPGIAGMFRRLRFYWRYPEWTGAPKRFRLVADVPGEPVWRVYGKKAALCHIVLVGRIVYVIVHPREYGAEAYERERQEIEEAAKGEWLDSYMGEKGFR